MIPVIRTFGIAFIAVVLSLSGGCGGSSSDGNANPTGVSVNSIDGTSTTAIDATFDYTFSSGISAATVTTATYFIREAPPQDGGGEMPAITIKATYDEAACDASSALPAAVSCSSSTLCTLDPTSNLMPNNAYLICLTTGISDEAGTAFEGFTARFTTAADPEAFTNPVAESLSFAAFTDDTGQAMFTVGGNAYLINGPGRVIMKQVADDFINHFTITEGTIDLLSTYSTQVLNDKAYIFGGLKDDGTCYVPTPSGGQYACATGETWVYDPVDNTLTLTSATLNDPRDVAASGVVDGRIYILGGWYPNAQAQNISTVEVFDGTSWSVVTTTGPFTAVRSPAFAAVGRKIYVIGGCVQTCQETMVQIFDTETSAFSQGAAMSLAGRHFSGQHAVARQDRYIYVFGGATDMSATKFNDVAVYDTQANQWQTLSATMTSERKSVGSTIVDDKLYIAGGGPNTTEVGTFSAQ